MAIVPPLNRSFMDASKYYSQGAIQARSAMRPNVEYEAPGKTVGGAIGAAAGMGMAGYGLATMGGTSAAGAAASGAAAGGLTGPQGAMIGAMIGLSAYLLS